MLNTPKAVAAKNNAIDGYTVEYLCDGRLVYCTLYNVKRQTVDLWAQTNIDIRKNWPEDKPLLLALHYIQDAPTPYMNAKSNEILTIRPEMESFFAFVVPRTFVAQIIKLGIRTLGSTLTKVSMQMFFSRDDSIKWLKLKGKLPEDC